MTIRQEVLEHLAEAAAKVIKQGCRSMLGNKCAYRGDGGTKCLAGHILKDEFYCESFEGAMATTDSVRLALQHSMGVEGLTFQEGDLIRELQLWHDGTRISRLPDNERLTLAGLEKFSHYVRKETWEDLLKLVKEKLQ